MSKPPYQRDTCYSEERTTWYRRAALSNPPLFTFTSLLAAGCVATRQPPQVTLAFFLSMIIHLFGALVTILAPSALELSRIAPRRRVEAVTFGVAVVGVIVALYGLWHAKLLWC